MKKVSNERRQIFYRYVYFNITVDKNTVYDIFSGICLLEPVLYRFGLTFLAAVPGYG